MQPIWTFKLLSTRLDRNLHITKDLPIGVEEEGEGATCDAQGWRATTTQTLLVIIST